jgi:hypothetical protein
VSDLERRGYKFTLLDDGAVSVRQPAERDPLASEMMNFLALHKDETRRHVRSLLPVQTRIAGEALTLTGLTPDEAFPIGEAIKRGEAFLVGKVLYHQKTGLFDLTFVPMLGGDENERENKGKPGRAGTTAPA